ncbi:MAG: mobile mystery protein A [Pseudomonadota bacterium]
MKADDRALARKHLDKKLSPLRGSHALARPPKGWVKVIRDALGMTAEQLALRIGVTKPRIYEIERSEASNSITLESLERAAHAMDCQLVYAFVPREPLEDTINNRAQRIARKRIEAASHTMALEDQAVESDVREQQIRALAAELLQGRASQIWEEE